jgi:hypothetical protein
MSTGRPTPAMTADQRDLVGELTRIKAALTEHARSAGVDVPQGSAPVVPDEDEGRSALHHVTTVFGLSPFERDVLLLAAGAELDAAIPPLCAAAQGDPRRAYPTFSLALATMDEPHWSALAPGGPLRAWRLIRLDAADGITMGRLRPDERVLHFLTGLGGLDERLHGLAEPVAITDPLLTSHQAVASRVAAVWAGSASPWPVIQLCVRDPATGRAVAAAACAELGLRLFALDADDIPADPADRTELVRLWQREVALEAAALLVSPDEARLPSGLRAQRRRATQPGGAAATLGGHAGSRGGAAQRPVGSDRQPVPPLHHPDPRGRRGAPRVGRG